MRHDQDQGMADQEAGVHFQPGRQEAPSSEEPRVSWDDARGHERAAPNSRKPQTLQVTSEFLFIAPFSTIDPD